MTAPVRDTLRGFIQTRLKAKDDAAGFTDSDSLFISVRLDSLDAMETVVFLEETFGINFADIGFDLALIDSIDAIIALVQSKD